jgi:hypothetical protein
VQLPTQNAPLFVHDAPPPRALYDAFAAAYATVALAVKTSTLPPFARSGVSP